VTDPKNSNLKSVLAIWNSNIQGRFALNAP